MTRAVFLDRDGVINRALVRNGRPYAPTSLNELEFLAGVPEAVGKLKQAGFLVIVVTNQPDVAAGLLARDTLAEMHERVRRELAVDDIKVCYHVDEDRCECRKPKPGMLLDAAAQWSLDLKRSYMVGDRWRDIAAGRAAGCKTILLSCNYNEPEAIGPDALVASLFEASELILSGKV